MELSIGQKVAYPNQGVCMVESIENKKIGENLMNFYLLRVLSDNSTIFVPMANVKAVGLRPIIDSQQYKNLINGLGEDFIGSPEGSSIEKVVPLPSMEATEISPP